MFTLRCTVRLQKRLRVPLDPTTPEPTTRLGDWYANLVHVGRQKLVIALSERTLLPVVVEAAPGEALVPRLVMAVTKALTTLAIPSGDISREIAAMSDVAFGKTGSRQVVGVMVDLANALQYYVRDGGSPRRLDKARRDAVQPAVHECDQP